MEKINGHILEFIPGSHTYVVDGIIRPSITQILKHKFGNKYAHVDRETLDAAAEAGTRVHEAIEALCKLEREMGCEATADEDALPEVMNFLFLRKHYKFKVLENEVPVILEDKNGDILAAGRLDLVIEMDGKIGGADIKRTATLDKEYLAHQLNLYRIAYRQTYGIEWEFLRGVHLREEKRKFVNIPIKEKQIWQFIEEWKDANI